MADRTVNVRINYIVNTADVQKAKAASEAAQKATDNLRKATTDYGKAASQAGRDSSGSLRQSQADIQSLAKGFIDLAAIVKTALVAGMLKETIELSLNLSKIAGNVESVSRAFQKQIPNATLLLNQLRKATQGTITDLELMQRTLKAQNFGIAIEKLPKLLEFAQIRAQQTGESVEYLVQSIVDGLGRKSILKLDNLGISASRLKEEFKGASLASLSVAEVTEGVSNIVEEELRKMGGAVETAATNVDQLTTSWTQLKQEVSEFFSGGEIPKILKSYVDSFKLLIKAINEGKSVQKVSQEQRTQEIASISANEFMTRRLTKSKEENVKILEEEIAVLTASLGAFAKQREAAKKVVEFLMAHKFDGNGVNPYETDKQIKLQEDFINQKKEDVLIDQEILKLLQAKILSLKKEAEEKEKLSIIEAKRLEVEQLQEEIEKTRNKSDLGSVVNRGSLIERLEKAQAELRELLGDIQTKTFNIKLTLNAKTAKTLSEENKKRIEAQLEEIYDNIQNLKPIPVKVQIITKASFGDNVMEAFEKRKNEIISDSFSVFADQLVSQEQAEVQLYQRRIDSLKTYYDDQMSLAGDNERAKKELAIKSERAVSELRKQMEEREWKARRNSIIIDTAAGIMRAFATMPTPEAVIESAIIAALGASQLAIVTRNKPRGFAKGVLNIDGPGTSTSDSIPAMLSKGESIMTASETDRSMGLLKMIKDNKIDDNILKKIDFSGGRHSNNSFNDARIVSLLDKIEKKKAPDIVKQGRALLEVHTDKEGNKRYIRSKSI